MDVVNNMSISLSKKKKVVAWIGVGLWMGIIFYLSHQPAGKSSELSSGVVDLVIDTFEKVLPFISFDMDLFHHIIRKGAHFSAYFILGVLIVVALKETKHFTQPKLFALALIVSVLYASSDEFHQLFIEGRSGELTDVLIDSAGIVTGISVFLFVKPVLRRIQKKIRGVRVAVTHEFSLGEEIANAITHGIGALLSIAALVLLIVSSSVYGNAWHVVSFTIFGVSMLFLYTSSTFVHALPRGKAKDVFEILDHSAIYFFIAGSYTPFSFIVIQGRLGWTLFGIIWGLAIGGTIFKVFFVKKYLFTSTLLYILMGWMIVLGWDRITIFLPKSGVILLVAGGIAYTFGAIFYMWRGFKYHHAIWHLFVIAGSVMHFLCVYLYLLPR